MKVPTGDHRHRSGSGRSGVVWRRGRGRGQRHRVERDLSGVRLEDRGNVEGGHRYADVSGNLSRHLVELAGTGGRFRGRRSTWDLTPSR